MVIAKYSESQVREYMNVYERMIFIFNALEKDKSAIPSSFTKEIVEDTILESKTIPAIVRANRFDKRLKILEDFLERK